MADNTGTRMFLGPVELDPCSFMFWFYCGPELRTFTIRQPAGKYAALDALPYITTLRIVCSAEHSTNKPQHNDLSFPGIRIKRVRQVNDKVCEVECTDARQDIINLICTADFNLAWKDGYLQDTAHRLLGDALLYLQQQRPVLGEVIAPYAIEQVAGEQDLPDGFVLAGGKMLPQLEQLAESIGATIANGWPGKLHFARLGQPGSTPPINVQAYNWAGGAEPSWLGGKQRLRGLPAKIRFHYPEKHAMRVFATDPTSTSPPDELKVEMRNVFSVGEKFLALPDLLQHFKLSRTAISEEQLARLINSENFEGTPIEPLGNFDTDARQLVEILKRDHNSLFQVYFPDHIGREGGWQELEFGYFETKADKDGTVRYTGAITARGVRAEYTAWLAKAEEDSQGPQKGIEGAVVARSYHRANNGGLVPEAPFTQIWVSEDDLVFRLEPGKKESSAARLWLGRMIANPPRVVDDKLVITKLEAPVDDQNVPQGTTGGLHFPTVADVQLRRVLKAWVYMVGTRRLPNSDKRWTAIEVETGLENPDVDVLEVEVGDELYSLRDYVDLGESRGPEADGRGRVLNREALQADADARAKALIDRTFAPMEGDGTALGTAAAQDLLPGLGIKEVRVEVDYPLVQTVVVVGAYDSLEARQERARKRAGRRKYVAAGLTIRGPVAPAQAAPGPV